MRLVSGADNVPRELSAPKETARKKEETQCTLCRGRELEEVSPVNDLRGYNLCHSCKLIFSDAAYLPDKHEEKSRYEQHNNGLDQPGYVNFLNRVINPARQFLTPAMKGLDYGCGPVPTLSQILAQDNITCFDYDPIFNFLHPLRKYDFIFSTEVFEHFHNPKKEIENLLSLLNQQGLLCIMTEQWESLDRFKDWYYKKDPTHVSLFHEDTFQYLCNTYGFDELYTDRSRVKILRYNNKGFNT